MTRRQIKTLRKRLGWTQRAMAEAVGVTRETVAKWECGLRKPSKPCVNLLNRIDQENQP